MTASYKLSAGDSPPYITESGIFKVSVKLYLTNFLIQIENEFLNPVNDIVSCARDS
jgi:hypothetical protein